jgi:uncharacterized RDD family membrane protein YckC
MSSPVITLHTVTGVDVELRIAGPGTRSYAFIIDWHIRLVLALAWLFIGQALAAGGEISAIGSGRGASSAWVWAPAAFIYFFYHPVLEIAMRGRTPGKRFAGARIVTREGDIPGAGALLLRNVFRVIDSLPFIYLVGLAVVTFTQQHVRVGDVAAGTLLVADHDSGAAAFAGGTAGSATLSPQAADLIQELMDRWNALDEQQRLGIARALLARLEPTLSADDLSQLDPLSLRSRLAAKLGTPA